MLHTYLLFRDTQTRPLPRLFFGVTRDNTMHGMRVVAAAALVLLGLADVRAFVSPSAFVRATTSSGPVGATATARAAGAMRSRPTMNVIDVREER